MEKSGLMLILIPLLCCIMLNISYSYQQNQEVFGIAERKEITDKNRSLEEMQEQMKALFPDDNTIKGWRKSGDVTFYVENNLFEYIDGAAEAFFAYGFKLCGTLEYTPISGENRYIKVDIYDMDRDIQAFGIYASEIYPDLKMIDIGTNGYIEPPLLNFWQGPYYVKIIASSSDLIEKNIQFAKYVSEKIPYKVKPPEPLKLLPVEDKVDESERYMLKNVLGYDFLENCVSANYKLGDDVKTLFIMVYENSDSAKERYSRLLKYEEENGSVTNLEDLGSASFIANDRYYKRIMVSYIENLIIVITSISNESDAKTLINRAIDHIQKTISSSNVDDLTSIIYFKDNEIPEWKSASPISIYDKETIFDYIDGAAELYFAYDFNKVVTTEYTDSNTSIIIDVYDMTNPDSAFGIYSLNRYEGANFVNIGNEGILVDTSLDFWKGKYYCKVYSFDTSQKYQNIVTEFGNSISSRIKDSGKEPEIIKMLPSEGLIPKSEKFFCRKLGLDNVHFISEDNIFNLDGNTKGIFAEYKLYDTGFQMLIIKYLTKEDADLAFNNFSTYLSKNSEFVSKNNESITFKKDNKYTIIKVNREFLVVAINIKTEKISEDLLNYTFDVK